MHVLAAHDASFYAGKSHYKYTVQSKSSIKKYTVKYYVHIECYTCSCPDFNFKRRHCNEMCKHIETVKYLDDNSAQAPSYKEYGVECFPGPVHDSRPDIGPVTVSEDHNIPATCKEGLDTEGTLEMVQDLLGCVEKLIISTRRKKI